MPNEIPNLPLKFRLSLGGVCAGWVQPGVKPALPGWEVGGRGPEIFLEQGVHGRLGSEEILVKIPLVEKEKGQGGSL